MRDTGLPSASARVTLVQEIDPEKQAGFLIYVPVYRDDARLDDVASRRSALEGFVYSPFRMDDLMRGIFGTETEPKVVFDLYDGSTMDAAHRLHAGVPAGPHDVRRSATVPIEVAGRTWTLYVESAPAFEAATMERHVPYLVVLGVLFNAALVFVTRAQQRARDDERAAMLEAQQAVHLRDEFLAIAGHELRTPLTALRLQVEGLNRQVQKSAFGPLLERLVERLAKAEGNVIRLDGLVRELLDVSRIASGRLALAKESVDLTDLVAEIVDRFGENVRRAGCAVSLTAEEHVVGCWDRGRLDQVVTNVLGNALKYGAGKPIAVRVAREDDRARVTIADRGIGIPPKDLGRIFARFERAVTDKHFGGLGLGLWISDEIVRASGGRIEVESSVGEGSTFSIVLPLAGVAPA